MESWYIAFNTYGTPQDILERLIQIIKELRLGDFITRFCYEKGANKKRGQFYVFFGVISQQRGCIPQVQQNQLNLLLQRMHLIDRQLYVTLDEVKAMVSKELEIHNLRTIKMHSLSVVPPTDPYNFSKIEITEDHFENKQASYNDLLSWLSIFGVGTWHQFRNVCQELGLDPTGEYSRRIARRLRSLAHIEMINEGKNWVIAPACFVETESPDGQFHTFLAGQRTPDLIHSLEQDAYIENEPQPYGDAPEIIRVTFPSKEAAEQIIQKHKQKQILLLAGSSGFKIACALPDLASWEKNLPRLTIIKSFYSFEHWTGSGFDSIELPKETGLYKLTHVSSRSEHPQLTLFYNQENESWCKADWYGLRYLALRRTGNSIKFYYDHHLKRLCIAKDHRIPDIYERPLVMASGRLPLFSDNYVIFGDVPDTIGHMLSIKLEAEYGILGGDK